MLLRATPAISSAYSPANPCSLSRFTVSWAEATRIGGVTSASAETNAYDNNGLKPWRLDGASRPKVATGSRASSVILGGSSADVGRVWVWDTCSGAHAATSIVENATTATRIRAPRYARGTSGQAPARTTPECPRAEPIQSDLRLMRAVVTSTPPPDSGLGRDASRCRDTPSG